MSTDQTPGIDTHTKVIYAAMFLLLVLLITQTILHITKTLVSDDTVTCDTTEVTR